MRRPGRHLQTTLARLHTDTRCWRAEGYAGGVECHSASINGCFVTAKEWPHNYDGCWDIEGVDPDQLDSVLLTFDRGRASQKAKYRGELFPAEFREGGSGTTFLEFFAIDKEIANPKGIIVID
jgi:hypothetical protein